jgi:predicted RNase H-like HicB family nuclease
VMMRGADYTVVLAPPDPWQALWMASIPALPGVVVASMTREAALVDIELEGQKFIDGLAECGERIPGDVAVELVRLELSIPVV